MTPRRAGAGAGRGWGLSLEGFQGEGEADRKPQVLVCRKSPGQMGGKSWICHLLAVCP